MIPNWAPRGSYMHTNETSWQSNKLSITTSIKASATPRGRKKKKNDPSKVTRDRTSLSIPCLLGRQRANLLWEEYVKHLYFIFTIASRTAG